MAPDIYRTHAAGSEYTRDRYVELEINRNRADCAGGGNARGQNNGNPERVNRPYGAGPRHTRDRHIELKINNSVAYGAGSREARDRHIELEIYNNWYWDKCTPSTLTPTCSTPAFYRTLFAYQTSG
jgi:hypothetical protein